MEASLALGAMSSYKLLFFGTYQKRKEVANLTTSVDAYWFPSFSFFLSTCVPTIICNI